MFVQLFGHLSIYGITLTKLKLTCHTIRQQTYELPLLLQDLQLLRTLLLIAQQTLTITQ